jgi:hypothetical protein
MRRAGRRGAAGVRTGLGAGVACVGAPGPLWLLGPLRLSCVWVWEAGAGLCGGYVRWIEPLGICPLSRGPDGVEWDGRMEGEEERDGRVGGLEREWEWEEREGSGMGGEGFGAKRDGHRAPRGGWPVWLQIPIYITRSTLSTHSTRRTQSTRSTRSTRSTHSTRS